MMEKWICISSVNDNFRVGKLYTYSIVNSCPHLIADNVVYHKHPTKLMSVKFTPAFNYYLNQIELCE